VTLIQRHFSTSIQVSNPTKIQRLFNVDGQLKFNVETTLMCLLGMCFSEAAANTKCVRFDLTQLRMYHSRGEWVDN
jgi:hypothetical protein